MHRHAVVGAEFARLPGRRQQQAGIAVGRMGLGCGGHGSVAQHRLQRLYAVGRALADALVAGNGLRPPLPPDRDIDHVAALEGAVVGKRHPVLLLPAERQFVLRPA